MPRHILEPYAKTHICSRIRQPTSSGHGFGKPQGSAVTISFPGSSPDGVAATHPMPLHLVVIPSEARDLLVSADRTYFVYILVSRSRNLYTRVTNNLQRRVFEHRQGIIPGFSRKYRIHRLVYLRSGRQFPGRLASGTGPLEPANDRRRARPVRLDQGHRAA